MHSFRLICFFLTKILDSAVTQSLLEIFGLLLKAKGYEKIAFEVKKQVYVPSLCIR